MRLFHRSTRTVLLTPEGALFLERCRRIFSEIEAAELELAQTKEAPHGTLRVSLPLVGVLMVPALSAFMRTYREIELELDFSDRTVDVIGDGFDVVLRAGEVSDSRLMSRMVGTFRLILVGSPDYFARRGIPQKPDDLKSHALPAPPLCDEWQARALAVAASGQGHRGQPADDSGREHDRAADPDGRTGPRHRLPA